MKVIVAGLEKTGTKTMCAALTLLGYEVYDWLENFYYLGDDWKTQIEGGFKIEVTRRMYENVDAVTDNPCNVHWEEIFKAFPGSKVILTSRDEKSWTKSVVKQFGELNTDVMFRLVRAITYTGYKAQCHITRVGRHMGTGANWPGTSFTIYPEEELKRFKRKHEKHVLETVPKNQLLVYEVKEGWEPLCNFLDVPVPDRPFPHKNKGSKVLDEMRKENPVMQRMQKELLFSVSVFCFLFLSLLINWFNPIW